jgi:hypothetical protein
MNAMTRVVASMTALRRGELIADTVVGADTPALLRGLLG